MLHPAALRVSRLLAVPLIKPFPLGGLTNISIIGDELPPGVADPEDAMGNTIVPLVVTTTQGPYNFNNESVGSCC